MLKTVNSSLFVIRASSYAIFVQATTSTSPCFGILRHAGSLPHWRIFKPVLSVLYQFFSRPRCLRILNFFALPSGPRIHPFSPYRPQPASNGAANSTSEALASPTPAASLNGYIVWRTPNNGTAQRYTTLSSNQGDPAKIISPSWRDGAAGHFIVPGGCHTARAGKFAPQKM